MSPGSNRRTGLPAALCPASALQPAGLSALRKRVHTRSETDSAER
jgi:hypothetical protein